MCPMVFIYNVAGDAYSATPLSWQPRLPVSKRVFMNLKEDMICNLLVVVLPPLNDRHPGGNLGG